MLRAYIDSKNAKISSFTHTSKGGYVSRTYSVVIKLDNTTEVEFEAYMDEARGVYIKSSGFTAVSDLKKGFIPQIINAATVFTFVEILDEGVMRELGWYKKGEAEALIELVHNKERYQVTIESKNLGDMGLLWDAIREGNILPYKLQVKTSKEPVIFAEKVLETVNELRKKLDWALDELARADRVIQHSNEMTAEWERISRRRKELISNLQSEIIFCG